MEFIDFTENQFKTEDGILKDNSLFNDFIGEYREVFDSKPGFEKSLKISLGKADPEITGENIITLKNNISIIEELLQKFSITQEIPGTIFFIGPGGWDGHGIIVGGKAYTFFDMTLLNFMMENPGYRGEVHNLHEMIHGIHYNIQREFYPGSYKTVRQKYLNKMAAEGIASYLSRLITGSSLLDAMGFGFMNEDEFNKWIRKCDELKKEIWEGIQKSIEKEEFDESLYNRLFFFSGDSITNGRYGYYYGFQAAKRISGDVGDSGLLSVKPDIFAKYIEDLFSR